MTTLVTFRPGTLEDSPAVFEIFRRTITDLGQRLGVQTISGGDDPEVLAQLWTRRRPLFEHLARTADQYWIAEKEGRIIGYARSIVRDGLQELTEFFVLSAEQSAGVGRGLLERALPRQGASHRAIVATTDTRAVIRYLKVGVYPRFACSYFSRPAQAASVPSDLTFEPISTAPDTIDQLRAIDLALLGHRRDQDHHWLLQNRQGYLYRRAGEPVGYGYYGYSNGPFALLNEADFPAVLAHAERQAASRGDDFGLEVPLINRAAVDYLLAQRFQMDGFITMFMSDKPFGKFENYIFPSPPFFI
jgi:hypothetical protein